MDKAGEAMLQGMILFALLIAAAIALVVWLVRRSRRKRKDDGSA